MCSVSLQRSQSSGDVGVINSRLNFGGAFLRQEGSLLRHFAGARS